MAEQGVKALGWASRDVSGHLSPFQFFRRTTGPADIQFKVLYCGICHSDLHTAKNEWGNTIFPIVPGHEIVGEVTEIGSEVKKFKIGDKVGVGCLVNSCRKCDDCKEDLENYCSNLVLTYNTRLPDGTVTQGGYSDIMVVDQDFAIRWPENFPMDKGAPLLCAGITTYSPLKYYGLDKPGQKIGVVGLGGLGHVAVKFAKAFGASVTVISTSAGKKKEALERFGAESFVVSTNAAEMAAAAGTLDGIIDTVSATHAIFPLMSLLKRDGHIIVVGAPPKPLEVPAFAVIQKRKKVCGSMIGGIKETQEMIDFAAKHGILPEVEMIGVDYLNTAMERMERADVKFRFVIDVGKTMKA